MISGITHLREQIQAEYEAAQRGLTGYAAVSRHDFINVRTIRLCQEELIKLIGEEDTAK